MKQRKSKSCRNVYVRVVPYFCVELARQDGRYILSRDYMCLKLWDVNMESKPLRTIFVHEQARPPSLLSTEDCSVLVLFWRRIFSDTPPFPSPISYPCGSPSSRPTKVGIPTPVLSNFASYGLVHSDYALTLTLNRDCARRCARRCARARAAARQVVRPVRERRHLRQVPVLLLRRRVPHDDGRSSSCRSRRVISLRVQS
jgi:hypothetical protein